MLENEFGPDQVYKGAGGLNEIFVLVAGTGVSAFWLVKPNVPVFTVVWLNNCDAVGVVLTVAALKPRLYETDAALCVIVPYTNSM